MVYKFTKRAEKAIELANQIAMEFGHSYIGTEHLLYGLVKEGEGVASKVLENQGITDEKVIEEIAQLVGKNDAINDLVGMFTGGQTIGITPRSKRVFENAFIEAKRTGSDYIGTEHLLIGIMREGDSVAVRIMLDLNIEPQKLYNEIIKVINDEETTGMVDKSQNKYATGSYNQTPTLNQ